MKILLLIALVASHSADAYFTNQNINGTMGKEHNPLQRPFVHGTPWLYTSHGLQLAGEVESYHLLWRHHKKLAEDLAFGSVLCSTEGAIQSFVERTHSKEKK